jgi:DNA-binding transcriptional MerR regulator
MLISEFAAATGLSRDTIRFYVRKGLLHPTLGSRETNRYQTFDDVDVERALMIRNAQTLGFTLREIAAIDAEFNGAGLPQERQAALMRERIAGIDDQVASLRFVRRYLVKKVRWLDAGGTGTPPALKIQAKARDMAI